MNKTTASFAVRTFSALALFAAAGCVLLAPVPALAEAPEQTEPVAEKSTVAITLDWSRAEFTVPRVAYSLNAFHSFNPRIAGNEKYRENIAYINPGMIRYHSSGVMGNSQTSPSGWMNPQTRSWDVEKIRETTAFWPKGCELMVNIPAWPSWMADENRLLRDEFMDEYAALCAELVRILNVELGLGVALWEPLNERELIYVRGLQRAGKPTQFGKLVTIYNNCARAMKAVDPGIQVGGPAISNIGWMDLIRSFVPGSLENLDFFSCHVYVTNDNSVSDERIFNAAIGFGDRVATLRAYLDSVSGGRHIPISVNEFNINWTYQTADPRMRNHKGAVFDALAMISMIRNGADSTLAWNDTDNVYGKMSRSFELFASAHLYHVLNGNFIGKAVSAQSSEAAKVVPFAVVPAVHSAGGVGAGRQVPPSLMLINRSAQEQEAVVSFAGSDADGAAGISGTSGAGWGSGTALSLHRIAEEGYTQEPLTWSGESRHTFTLPPFSVTLLTAAPAAEQREPASATDAM